MYNTLLPWVKPKCYFNEKDIAIEKFIFLGVSSSLVYVQIIYKKPFSLSSTTSPLPSAGFEASATGGLSHSADILLH